MTEFEQATIAYQNAALWAAYGQIAATLAVGVLHAWLILSGLRMMRRAADSRDKALDEQRRESERRHEEAMENHRATVKALDESIRAGRRQHEQIAVTLERQGAALESAVERQGAALERQGEALERQGAALERQGAALESAVERQGVALERQGAALEAVLGRRGAGL